MNQKIVENIIKKLGLEPKAGSALYSLTLAVNNDKTKQTREETDESSAGIESGDVSEDKNKQTFEALKQLQVVRLSKPILELAIEAKSHSQLAMAKSAGVEMLIDIPDNIRGRLNSLAKTLDVSRENLRDLNELEVGDLVKKFKLAEPPQGLELSVFLTLAVAAIATLMFVVFSVNDLTDSPEAYWGLFAAGVLFLIGVNFCVTNLIRVLKFKKNKNTIFAEARRKYLEKEGDKFSKLQKAVEEEAFNIQIREYSKASRKKCDELNKEEVTLLTVLNSNAK
jgi:hypothetical protein